jgi:hypothetical protein
VAQQRSNAHVLDNLFQRHLQLFLIFVFVVPSCAILRRSSIASPGFVFDFIQLRLRHAQPKQEMVNPTGERVGAIKHAHLVAFRQIELNKKPSSSSESLVAECMLRSASPARDQMRGLR